LPLPGSLTNNQILRNKLENVITHVLGLIAVVAGMFPPEIRNMLRLPGGRSIDRRDGG
jgi:hypothetical protein